jgi:hypothetical protein
MSTLSEAEMDFVRYWRMQIIPRLDGPDPPVRPAALLEILNRLYAALLVLEQGPSPQSEARAPYVGPPRTQEELAHVRKRRILHLGSVRQHVASDRTKKPRRR